MKRFAVAISIAILCGLAPSAEAGFKDGMAAHAKGDFSTAILEFHEAAERGNGLALFSLGFMFYKGQGVKRDPVQAYLWFNLATMYLSAGRNQDKARQNRDIVAGGMTARQIATAEGLTKDWETRIARNLVPPSPLPMPAAGPARASGAKR
ncbi:MAG: hypothetical protein V3T02_12000 [Alphaproteobacteria bacterium]